MTWIIEQILIPDAGFVQAYARLAPQLNPAHVPPSLAQFEAMLRGGATELFAARDRASGEVIGALALAVFTTPSGVHAWIEDVVVDTAWRGQGIGADLTRAALVRAAERGARAVDLTSRPERAAANALYLKMGFEIRSTNLYRFDLRRLPSK